MENKHHVVSFQEYHKFLENYKGPLKKTHDFGFMHEEWVDENTGEMVASMMHGFASNLYSVRDEYKNETVELLTNIMNKYGK